MLDYENAMLVGLVPSRPARTAAEGAVRRSEHQQGFIL